jgi:tRNA(Arg) A34 adenosine deaminase TadA
MRSSSPVPNQNNGMEDFFMRKALKVAEDALKQGEVPVGCVIVLREAPESKQFNISPKIESNADDLYDYNTSPEVIVSHGANQVNASRDATRHSECIAIDRMLTGGMMSDQSRLPQHIIAKAAHGNVLNGLKCEEFRDEWVNVEGGESSNHWKNDYGWRSGKLFQKEILKNCDLYVTCEPCIMVSLF